MFKSYRKGGSNALVTIIQKIYDTRPPMNFNLIFYFYKSTYIIYFIT